MSTPQWFKNIRGKVWHIMRSDSVWCGRDNLIAEPKKFGPRDFPAQDAKICKGCLYAIADRHPGDLIGLAWYEQPTESELVKERIK